MATAITVNARPQTQLVPGGDSSFVQRLIELRITLATSPKTNQPNQFAGGGGNQVRIFGSRTSVRIENSGAPVGSAAAIKVWGLTPSLMNQLSTLGISISLVERNTLIVLAGDEVSGFSNVFGGTITSAYADYNSSPDVPFQFECNSGLADAVTSASPSSFTTSADVATIMQGLATKMGLGFENSGVNVQLSNPYFPGNLWTQMRTCAEHANVNAEVINGTLCLWPKNGTRDRSGDVPLISKDTGMIGYPSFTQNGIVVKSIFNPLVDFGSSVRVRSRVLAGATQSVSADVGAIIPADGTWSVYKLDHALDSLVPKGQWMSTIYAYNPKNPQPVAPGPRG